MPVATLAVVLFDGFGKDPAQLLRGIVLILVLDGIVLCIFGHLSIILSEQQLRWQFGFFGRPRWILSLQDIAHVEVCETRWYEGKGIRFTREGMLYNAAGRGAVRIIKRDNTRLRLGSAEPEILCEQLRLRMAALAAST